MNLPDLWPDATLTHREGDAAKRDTGPAVRLYPERANSVTLPTDCCKDVAP